MRALGSPRQASASPQNHDGRRAAPRTQGKHKGMNRKRNNSELMTVAASVSRWMTALFPCETRGRRHQLIELNICQGLVQGTISQNPVS